MSRFLINKMGLGQSSIEFFILTGLAFLAVILFVGLSANEIKEYRDQKQFLLVKDLALKLQKEVVIATSVEDGYKRDFTLPDKLESIFDYSINVGNSTITVTSSKTLFTVAIVNVTGDFKKGSNKIEKRDNGRIYVNAQ